MIGCSTSWPEPSTRPTPAPLSAAPVPLARRAIRTWLSVDGYPPDAAAVARVLEVAAGAHSACEVAGVGRVRRSHQRLSVEPITPTRFPSTRPTG